MDGVRHTNWAMVMLLWAAGMGAAAQYGKISVIFGDLPRIYPDAGVLLGFTVSLVGAIGILLGVAAGVVVARIGYRRAILGGLWIGAAMSAVQVIFPPLPVFLASRMIEGAAHLAMVVAIPTMIAQISTPEDRGLSLTIWGTFFGGAFAVLSFIGVPLAQEYGPWLLMLVHALYMGLMALILAPILPVIRNAPPEMPEIGEILRAHARIYGSARIGAPALGWLFYTICFVSILTVLPPFIPEETRRMTMVLIPLMSIASSLTLGVYLMRAVSPVTVIALGFVLSASFALALILIPGSSVIALALGASLGLVQGASFAAVPHLNEPLEDRALANGGLAQMGNLGNTIGTPIMVAVIAGQGYGGLMIALALVFCLGAAIHMFLASRRGVTS